MTKPYTLHMCFSVCTWLWRDWGVGLACLWRHTGSWHPSIQVRFFLELCNVLFIPNPLVSKPVGHLRVKSKQSQKQARNLSWLHYTKPCASIYVLYQSLKSLVFPSVSLTPWPETQWWNTSWPAPPWPPHWGRGLPGGHKNIHSKYLPPACWSFFVSAWQRRAVAAIHHQKAANIRLHNSVNTPSHAGKLKLRGSSENKLTWHPGTWSVGSWQLHMCSALTASG